MHRSPAGADSLAANGPESRDDQPPVIAGAREPTSETDGAT